MPANKNDTICMMSAHNGGTSGKPLLNNLLGEMDRQLEASRPEPALDLLAWGRRFLPDHFRLPPSRMHQWLARRLDAMRHERGRKLNVLGPRGGAKSTVATLAYVLRSALEAHEPYIWIVSDTKQQAHRHLANVKAELEDNKQLLEHYAAAMGRGRVWQSAGIVLRNGVMIEALSTGQRIRGRRLKFNRPSLIVCDDLQNDSHVRSASQRMTSRHWFHSALMNAGTEATNVINLATALHREALAMELDRTPGWTSRIFKSIEAWPSNLDLWHSWESIYAALDNTSAREDASAFYERNRAAMDAGGLVLWPEWESLYALMCSRVEKGRAAFEREKQNSPINPDLCEWPADYFGSWIWFDEWPTSLATKLITLDPSKGQDSRFGDYSAYVLLGAHHDGVYFIEADLARRPTPQMVAEGVEHCIRFRPQLLAVEANQYQHLLRDNFEAEMVRRRLHGIAVLSLENHVNKQLRLRCLGPLLSQRKLRFKANSPSTKLLVPQLQDFPLGEHDDGPDALEMAVRIARDLNRPIVSDGLGNRLIPYS